jgi:cystathionine beta-synthase
VHKAYTVADTDAMAACRELLAREGIIAGTSSGILLAAALRYCREQVQPRQVVTFVCDSGNKYLSKVYNDYWMIDQGFLRREPMGDLRDLIVRRHKEQATVVVNATETVGATLRRMKLYDVSQLPVMRDGRIVGIVDEEDILVDVYNEPERFDAPVTTAMSSHLVTVQADAPISQLMETFKRGLVAIVMKDGEFQGLITRIDLLNWLRHRKQA